MKDLKLSKLAKMAKMAKMAKATGTGRGESLSYPAIEKQVARP
jgi:hypothetical protein